MDTTKDTNSLPQPEIISMEVDDEDSYLSEYRLQIGTQVKYLVVNPGTYDRDTLSFLLSSLPPLQYDAPWTVANISRSPTGSLLTTLSTRKLAGVKTLWHPITISCLDLGRTKQLTASPVIVKIARFEWEIPRLERETRAYQLLEGSGLAPPFLGHISEGERVIGFVLEKLVGRAAGVEDLEACQEVLGRLHGMGVVNEDMNRYNFVVTDGGVKIIDFEGASEEAKTGEMERLKKALGDTSGSGGGFIFHGDDV